VLVAGFDTKSKVLRFVEFENLIYSGNVATIKNRSSVEYGDFKLTADQIQYDRSSQDIHLEGHVVVEGEGVVFNTTKIDYNFKLKLGQMGALSGQWTSKRNPLPNRSEIFQVKEESKTFYLKAESAELKQNGFGKPSFILRKVRVTDCDEEKPHHDVSLSRVIYSSQDKIELSHLVLRIFGIPYFYWPYAVKDIYYDWPWTRWEFGKQADWGAYGKAQTHLLPESTNKNLKIGLDYRSRRGRALHLNFDKDSEVLSQNININLYDERWEDQNGSLHFEDKRYQFDLKHDQKLDDHWSFRIDAHHQSPTESFLWDDGNRYIKSQNRYVAPVLGAKQIREGVLEEYDELVYREGALQEQEIAVSYWEGSHYFELGSTFSSDGEQILQREKWLELNGRMIPSHLLGESLLYSNEYVLGKVGQRLGHVSSAADQQFVLGSVPIRDRFHNTRAFLDQTVELELVQSSYLQATPFIGSRSLYYERALKRNFEGQGFWQSSDAELENGVFSNRFKSGLELATRLDGRFGADDFRHTMRPSIRLTYLSPTGFDMDQVLAPVDSIDVEKFGRYESVYSLDNEFYSKRNGKMELFYLSGLQWRQILKAQDQTEIFGVDEREAQDLWLTQSFYPSQQWTWSLDSSMNTFSGQFPTLRAGLAYQKNGFQAKYFWNKIKDFSLANSLLVHRHDVEVLYQAKRDDFQARVSWDEEPQQNIVIKNSLYEHGFRRFELIWGHLFHCLRSEIEMNYDFEGGGTSLIFRFGPGLFNENLPRTRFPL